MDAAREPSFGDLLKGYRIGAGLSQEALAERAGLSVRAISDLERGIRLLPRFDTVTLLADALALDPSVRATLTSLALRGRLPQPASDPPATRLPLPATPLIGREAELAALDRLLGDPAVRLVAIVGPGGIGKTRLALAAAGRHAASPRFPGGVRFVELAALAIAARLAPALATALGAPPAAGGEGEGSARRQALDYLREKRLLLVLDNVEHLLDGAEFFATIAASAPGVVLLATSRERLRLRGEHLFPLEGLPVPARAGDGADHAAVRLYLDAARRVRPDFAPDTADLAAIGETCRAVGGLPLAIELAAAWSAVLPPAAIAAELRRGIDLLATELRDVPGRQRSIRAVCDAAWDRLGPDARAAFARLAVCRGGFDRDAAATIAGADVRDLARLADAALVTFDPAGDRYAIHELLRAYGAERLAGDPAVEAQARDAHAAHYLGLVARQAARLHGPDQPAALAAIERERDNIRAAWDRAPTRGLLAPLSGAVAGLGRYYELRGPEEGEAAFGQAAAALERGDAAVDARGVVRARLLARLLGWRGVLARLLGRLDEAERALRRSLAILEAPGLAGQETRAERAFALLRLGEVIFDARRGDAGELYERSLNLYRSLGDTRGEGAALWQLGRLANRLTHLDRSERFLRQSLALREAAGDRRAIAETLDYLSQTCVESGRLDEALHQARRAHDLYQELGDDVGRASGLRRWGLILIWAGRLAEARPLFEESLSLAKESGARGDLAWAHYYVGTVLTMLGDYAQGELHARRALSLDREHGGAAGVARSSFLLGMVLLGRGAEAEAEAALRESAAGVRGGAEWAVPVLGYLAWRRGDAAGARRTLLTSLRASIAQHSLLPVLLAFPGIALLLAADGQPARAVGLWALACRFPLLGGNRMLLDTWQDQFEAIAAGLPPEEVAAARERGGAADYWPTAEALLVELTRLGWAAGAAPATPAEPGTGDAVLSP